MTVQRDVGNENYLFSMIHNANTFDHSCVRAVLFYCSSFTPPRFKMQLSTKIGKISQNSPKTLEEKYMFQHFSMKIPLNSDKLPE